MADFALEMRHITKRFPGVLALDDVNFACKRGEVHALVGENGAGKSTLMKILAGAYPPDGGEIVLNGEAVHFRQPNEAQALGVSIIYQDFNLLPHLNVMENIFIGHEPRRRLGLIDRPAMRRETQLLLDGLGISLDLQERVGRLSVAEQQMVEIAKTLSRDASIIAMDEPSAVLAGHELERLFEIIEALKAQDVAIIYISHRLDEVFQIADRVTVLKDGRWMHTSPIAEVSKPQLIRLMVGRTLDEAFPAPSSEAKQQVVLEVEGLSKENLLHDISFKLHRGEILGFAGLVGAGSTAVARAIFGADPADSGDIYLNGQLRQFKQPRQAVTSGIALVPEDRKNEALVMGMSVRDNITLPVLDRIQRFGWLNNTRVAEMVRKSIDEFSIKTSGPAQEVQYLSGGNQQKVVLAKWIGTQPEVVILDEPTHGVDVGAKAEVYEIIRRLAANGTAIIMISSELPEIMGMSDRILVMRRGHLVGELAQAEATEEKILTMAT
jgi:ribose transport system ATP-binding protein